MRKWLIDLRNEKQMKQGDVARAVGISPPSYCNIENGKTNPTVPNAKKIGEVLGFPWEKMFDDLFAE